MRFCCRAVLVYSLAFVIGQLAPGIIVSRAYAEDVVQISTKILPPAQVGLPYSAPVVVSDGAPPFQWYLTSGSLPSGLALNSQTGAISGTPGAAGTFSFGVGVRDSEGFSTSISLSLVAASGSVATSPIYGAGVGSDGLCNTTVGPYEHHVSYRFRARHSGVLQNVMIYVIPNEAGYAGGTGGTIQVTMQTDDGSSAHNPSGNVLATYYMSNVASLPAPQRNFYVIQFASSPTLTAGQLYHLVFQNVDSNPSVNFISVDSLYQSNVQSSLPTAPVEPDAAVLMTVDGGPWSPRAGFTPVYELNFQNGASEGIGYMEAWVGDQQNIGGSNTVRETFTVTGSQLKVNSAAIRLSRIAGDEPLVVRFEHGDGTLIEEGYVPATNIPMSSASSPINAWAIYPFSTTYTLTPGETYHLVFEASSGTTYQAYPVQQGGYYSFQPTTFFPDGYAEVKLNDSWTGWTQWGVTNRTDGDLQFYMTLAQ